jgi:precorrin-6B methylase 2
MRPFDDMKAKVVIFLALVHACSFGLMVAAELKNSPPLYETKTVHDPNGIGKFYLGREIAQVMGHQGADWLERPERAEEERPDLLMAALKLKKGDVVADIGAGTGYISWRMAQLVGEKGIVYGVDIQQEMLDLLEKSMTERGLKNVKPVLGTISDPKLPPASVDLIIMVDVYHEFSEPSAMMAGMCAALKKGGRLVFVEYRGEDPSVPIKLVHKMTEAQVKKEAALHPLEWIETNSTLPRQHIIFFRKK